MSSNHLLPKLVLEGFCAPLESLLPIPLLLDPSRLTGAAFSLSRCCKEFQRGPPQPEPSCSSVLSLSLKQIAVFYKIDEDEGKSMIACIFTYEVHLLSHLVLVDRSGILAFEVLQSWNPASSGLLHLWTLAFLSSHVFEVPQSWSPVL